MKKHFHTFCNKFKRRFAKMPDYHGFGQRRERGQSLVELAISLTVLLLLLAGVVDIGRAFFAFIAMRDAAQEGASYGSLYPTQSGSCTSFDRDSTTFNSACIHQRIRNATNTPINFEQAINNGDITITITLVGGQACAGNTIQVDIDYPNYPMIMPLYPVFMGSNSIPLHATVTDQIVRPPCP